MGFRNGAYAKVWSIKPPKEGRASSSAQISISVKDKRTGGYETDFSGWVSFIGKASAEVQQLTQGARIKLGDVDLSTSYDKEKEVAHYYPKVFSFEMADGDKPTQKQEDYPFEETKTPAKPSVEENDVPDPWGDDAAF